MPYSIDKTSFISPNHNSRGTAIINLVVLHATVGDAIPSLRHLCTPAPINPKTRKPDPDLAVSIHYLITRDGRIYQLVNESEAAWHAGAARWRDMASAQIRNGSIGIELENANTGKDPYPMAQRNALTWLVSDLLTRYPLPLDHIVSHAEIAIPAGRKTDPKGFDIPAFRAALAGNPPPLHTVTAGLHGAIAQEDRRPGALAARYYPPGTPIVCDDLTSSYWHTLDQAGFIPVGQVQA